MELILKILYTMIGLRTNRFTAPEGEEAYWRDLYTQLNGPGICGPEYDDHLEFVVIFMINSLNWLYNQSPNWQLIPFPCF